MNNLTVKEIEYLISVLRITILKTDRFGIALLAKLIEALPANHRMKL